MADRSYFDLMGFGPEGWGPLMLMAAGVTVSVAIFGFLLGALIGAGGAAMKLSSNPIANHVATAYTTIFRGIPELLIVYLFYFGGSLALTKVMQSLGYTGFVSVPAFIIGGIAIGVVQGAYQTEVFRAAFGSIDKGELEAGRGCGMGRLLLLRRIIIPQVLRFGLPGMGNVWQSALKESTLLSVTGLVEILRQASIGAGSTREPFAFYLTAGLLYLAITTVSGWGFGKVEARSLHPYRRS